MGRSSSMLMFTALILAASTAAIASTPVPGSDASPRDAGRMIAGTATMAQGYGDGFGAGGGFGPPYPGAGMDGPPPPPPFALAPPPCIRPIIIEVGRGLEHRVKTRIVYGARPPCG